MFLRYLAKLVFLHFDQPDDVSSAYALSRAPPGSSVSERLGTRDIEDKKRKSKPKQIKLGVSSNAIINRNLSLDQIRKN